MKNRLTIFLLSAFFLFISVNSVYALSINIFHESNSTGIDNWKNNLGGGEQTLETFSSVATGWYTDLTLPLGTFTTQGSSPGTGDTSYRETHGLNPLDPDYKTPYFHINDGTKYGRSGDPYLDSSDITLLTLNLAMNLNNLFFYIQDPSDVGARTDIDAFTLSWSDSDHIDPLQTNGDLWFVGISTDSDEFLKSISWSTSNDFDGYGLDNFSTVVPEPGTLVLFGFGLLGLAGVSRRRSHRS